MRNVTTLALAFLRRADATPNEDERAALTEIAASSIASAPVATVEEYTIGPVAIEIEGKPLHFVIPDGRGEPLKGVYWSGGRFVYADLRPRATPAKPPRRLAE